MSFTDGSRGDAEHPAAGGGVSTVARRPSDRRPSDTVGSAAGRDRADGRRTADDRDRAAGQRMLSGLVDALVEVDRALNALTAMRTLLVDRVYAAGVEHSEVLVPGGTRDEDLLHRAVAAELACALRLPEATAEGLVDEARVLVHRLPGTMTALAEGRISYRHAAVMADRATELDAAELPGFENALLPRAQQLTAARFRHTVRRWCERRHPETLTARHTRAAADRRVWVDPAEDGMAWFGALLPAVQAHAAFHRLSDIAAALQEAGESRTLPQLRADALAALLLDAPVTGETVVPTVPEAGSRPGEDPRDDVAGEDRDAVAGVRTVGGHNPITRLLDGKVTDGLAEDDEGQSGEDRGPANPDDDGTTVGTRPLPPWVLGIRPTVAVTVPVLTLLGRSAEPGHLEGHGPIDADTARALAAGASSFTRILTHPETGAVLSVGREKYAVPADLKAWLRLRDGTCRFWGCARRAERCEVDHAVAWQHGGTTAHDNLAHLCPKHHHLKHESRWRLSQDAHGVQTWTSPAGRVYRTEPAHDLPVTRHTRAGGMAARGSGPAVDGTRVIGVASGPRDPGATNSGLAPALPGSAPGLLDPGAPPF